MFKVFGLRLFLLGTILIILVLLFGGFGWQKVTLQGAENIFTRDYSQAQYLLTNQNIDGVLLNPLKHAIRNAISAGVSVETIVLLLLLPAVAAFIAAARHLIGLRGFGIFLPAALAAVFAELGPVAGILLFLLIVTVSTLVRFFLRKLKVKLQYLPRMAILLWTVVLAVLGVLLLIPLAAKPDILFVSIFPVLILILLAEDFTRVQLGKSINVAISLTSETVILALLSFGILEFKGLQNFAILNPEAFLILVLGFDIFLGRYSGLRLIELWRFRRLIKA